MPNRRKILLLLADIFCYILSGILFLGILMTGDSVSAAPVEYRIINNALIILFVFLSRLAFRTYRNVWRYASTSEYFKLILADFIGGCVYLIVRYALPYHMTFLRSVSIIAVACLMTIASRCVYQMLRAIGKTNSNENEKDAEKINVAIVGAGVLGASLAGELKSSLQFDSERHIYKKYVPAFFIDNDECKIGSYINGIKVFGENDVNESLISKFNIREFIIALPNMPVEGKKHIYEIYSALGIKVKIYDYPLANDNNDKSMGGAKNRRVLRDFRIEDLLFRDVQTIVDKTMQDFYRGKVILITGGGGSIGSELCRQIAKCNPKKLVIVDIYENNAYDIQQELLSAYNGANSESPFRLDLSVEIASVRDYKKIDEIFSIYHPQIVFHAAAHKHVPLMENSPSEAIKNNVFGTYTVSDIAEKHGVEKFIMISTDKAVNPTNVMGASKRMCEMIIQSKKDSRTSFSAVRFGNVLGSNGSVIPLFKKQIENGGPVTLTDKRIIRYFMTIPEASQLVMTAGAMAKSGELYVLDMGNPVKIIDLAENMIRLSGYTPYKDIDIVEIGLRPGEKLYEELLIKAEELDKTDNKMIFIERDEGLGRDVIDEKLGMLQFAVEQSNKTCNNEIIREALMKVVPTFRKPEDVNREAEVAEEMKNTAVVSEVGVN